MPENELTIAKVLRQNGYTTGHAGKWHMAAGHHSFPGPEDQGFDFSTLRKDSDVRGVQRGMKNRLVGFATSAPNDPYRLDSEGFPTDPITTSALNFMAANKEQPFFLYYASWLVHTPIQSRSKSLLEKYCRKLGVEFPVDPKDWSLNGQKNPYYCAMVETLDHYVGQLVEFLASTDDPRNPGRKLIDNTYIIFSSDNGGMEVAGRENITDNAPLDEGKMSAREGGVRVPFLVAGPGIPAGQKSDVIVNGLDFYPTILSMAGIAKPNGKSLDGADLLTLLTKSPGDTSLVLDQNHKPRTEMVWHFPHPGKTSFQSTIRAGDFKLIHNHDPEGSRLPEFELYRLSETRGRQSSRRDLEESKNLADEMPIMLAELRARLAEVLSQMNASMPYWNPAFSPPLPNMLKVPQVTRVDCNARNVEVFYKENGARVLRVDLIYTTNPGSKDEEWFRITAASPANGAARALLPEQATHFFVNLIDENHFLVSHPSNLIDTEASFAEKATPLLPVPKS